MPTNVTVEYVVAEKEYSKAITAQEKIKALENMYVTVPKHKNTEKLRQEIKTKLAKYKDKSEKEAKKSKGKSLAIKKKGAATIVLVGPPNSGKSTLLNKLTGKKVEINDYEFTTKKPEVGIMKYKGLKLQMVELPAITEGYGNKEKGPSFFSVIRNADLVVILTDTAELDSMFREFENADIALNDKLRDESKTNLKAVIVINKADLESFGETYMGLYKYYNFDLIPISAINDNLNMLADRVWKYLGLIKVYTKEPGKRVKKDEPICLKKDAKIEDMAKNIHKDFIRKFRFARVWGKSARFSGMKSGLKHKLEDEDVVEVHMK